MTTACVGASIAWTGACAASMPPGGRGQGRDEKRKWLGSLGPGERTPLRTHLSRCLFAKVTLQILFTVRRLHVENCPLKLLPDEVSENQEAQAVGFHPPHRGDQGRPVQEAVRSAAGTPKSVIFAASIFGVPLGPSESWAQCWVFMWIQGSPASKGRVWEGCWAVTSLPLDVRNEPHGAGAQLTAWRPPGGACVPVSPGPCLRRPSSCRPAPSDHGEDALLRQGRVWRSQPRGWRRARSWWPSVAATPAVPSPSL